MSPDELFSFFSESESFRDRQGFLLDAGLGVAGAFMEPSVASTVKS